MKHKFMLRLSLLTAVLLITSALVAQEAKIRVTVYPPEAQILNLADVMQLHKQNPNKPAFAKGNSQALHWAYNRRVDIALLPNEQKSTQFFPGDADEARLLFKSEWPSRRLVEKAGEGSTTPPLGGGAH